MYTHCTLIYNLELYFNTEILNGRTLRGERATLKKIPVKKESILSGMYVRILAISGCKNFDART